MNRQICTCGIALGIFVVSDHLCPVHYRESFVLGQHPLHDEPETPQPAVGYFVASGVSSLAVNVHDHLTVDDGADNFVFRIRRTFRRQ